MLRDSGSALGTLQGARRTESDDEPRPRAPVVRKRRESRLTVRPRGRERQRRDREADLTSCSSRPSGATSPPSCWCAPSRTGWSTTGTGICGRVRVKEEGAGEVGRVAPEHHQVQDAPGDHQINGQAGHLLSHLGGRTGRHVDGWKAGGDDRPRATQTTRACQDALVTRRSALAGPASAWPRTSSGGARSPCPPAW